VKCSKITFKDAETNEILTVYGLLTKIDDDFYSVQTKRKIYQKHKSLILSSESTDIDFIPGD